jgi:Phosphotransferase enzyme family
MELAAIELVTRRYSERFRPNRCELPPTGLGFSGAIVRRIETGSGLFCLRGWPPETTHIDRVLGLHRWLGHLCERGVQTVAVPVAASDGRTLVIEEGRAWQIEPWLKGCADFRLRPTRERLTAAMTALAELHRAAAGFRPAAPEREWFRSDDEAIAPAVSERLERLRSWKTEVLGRVRTAIPTASISDRRLREAANAILAGFERTAPTIQHELLTASHLRVPVQPCLRDVWHDHILFEGDKVTGIVDPSAARGDTVAADLSRLLGSLVGDDRPMWEVALSAYQACRPLSTDARRRPRSQRHALVRNDVAGPVVSVPRENRTAGAGRPAPGKHRRAARRTDADDLKKFASTRA